MSQDILEWLILNSGSVIRYRTVSELLAISDTEKNESLRREMLSDNMVQTWLNRINPSQTAWGLHGSKSDQYENIMGKLYEFGLRKGINCFDKKTDPFHHYLRQQFKQQTVNTFYCMLVAAFLAMTGYSEDEPVNTWIQKRLEMIHQFAKNPDFEDIYIPQDTYQGFPKAFRKKPLLNPEIEHYLPSIHDINTFLHCESIMKDRQLRDKAETIVRLVLSPEYQNLCPGYGITRDVKTGRYYAAGWSVHVPGYFQSDKESTKPHYLDSTLLLRLSMMSRSKSARNHPWFKNSLSYLESYRTDNGLLTFPRKLMPEKNVGYWISGYRLGLESNRRTKTAITCESTFRYYEIIKEKV